MADNRNIVLSRVLANGYAMQAEIEGYTAPEIKKITEAAKGGRFVAGETTVGLEPLKGKLVISGVTDQLLLTFGIESSEYSQITVLASTQDEAKNKTPLRWEHTCEITSITGDEIKPGVMKHTIEFVCRGYKHTDNGNVIHDIDVPTQKAVVFGKDLLDEHRKNVELA